MYVALYSHNGPVTSKVETPDEGDNWISIRQGPSDITLMLSDDGLSDLARMCEVALMERARKREVKVSDGAESEQVAPPQLIPSPARGLLG